MFTKKWHPNSGYCIKPEYIFDDCWRKAEEFGPLTGSPEYLKLHGSTNWLTPYQTVNLTTGQPYTLNGYAMDKLYVFLKASHPYETYENRYWGPYDAFSYCYYPPNLPLSIDTKKKGYKLISFLSAYDLPEHGKIVQDVNTVYSMPLIVPPIRNKKYMRYGKIFSRLWGRAETAISKCRQLYLIGYSFPDTDTVSKNMFKKAISQNKGIDKIVIINPSPQRIENILVNEFGINPSKIKVRAECFKAGISDAGRILDC
jgi:hypothetical protein